MNSTVVSVAVGVLSLAGIAGGYVIYQQHINVDVHVQPAAPATVTPPPEVVYVQPAPAPTHRMPAGDIRTLPPVRYWNK